MVRNCVENFEQKILSRKYLVRWMDGWMDGGESWVKDCLQQSKILNFGYFKKWEKNRNKI